MVRDQFLLLEALQQLDGRIRAFTDEQEALPQQLRPYESTCVVAREALAALQVEIEQTERQRRALERELDNDQAQLVKTQSRLHGVKTNKEYSAVLTEIEMRKQKIATIEDRVLELMESAEQRHRTLREYEQRVQDATQELEKQEDRIAQARRVLAQRIATNDAERQQIRVQLKADLYAVYEKLSRQRDGLAVVHIYDGTCGGCHLTIRPQLVSEIRRQETLVTCPHCQRMLLWPA